MSTSDASLAMISPFGDCSDCSRWSPEFNQTQNKYFKGFQKYNFGLGLGGILHWKISFSFYSPWRQLLTYSGDQGIVVGQRTSIKWSASYSLHLVVLLLQLLYFFLPIILHKQKNRLSCVTVFLFSSSLLLSSLPCVLTILLMDPTSIHLGLLCPHGDNSLYLDLLFWACACVHAQMQAEETPYPFPCQLTQHKPNEVDPKGH